MDFLLKIDTTFFHLINGYLSNPLFDMIMPIFHHTKFFLPFLIFPWILAIILDSKNRWKLAFLIPLAIILVDQSGLLIKKTILRPRPFVIINPEIINHLVKPSGINLSFPSNHAANNAVLAVIFSSVYDNLKHVFWGMAMIIMFSRVYIGVHYPLDVIFGCILGIFYGLLLVKGWDYFVKNKDLKLTI